MTRTRPAPLRRVVLCAALVLASGWSATAQWTPKTFAPTFQPFQSLTTKWSGFFTREREADGWNDRITTAVEGSTSGTATFKHALTRTDFRFQGQPVQQRNCAPGTSSATERQQLTNLCLQLLRTIEATPGFRKSNLAAALTVLLGLSLQVYVDEEISDAVSERLQRVLNEMLIETGLYARLKPADVQELYESSIMLGGLIATLAESAKSENDTALAKTAKNLAASVLKSFGFAP